MQFVWWLGGQKCAVVDGRLLLSSTKTKQKVSSLYVVIILYYFTLETLWNRIYGGLKHIDHAH